MRPSQVRETIASLDGRLDDVRREQAWRGIENSLDRATDTRRAGFWRYRYVVVVAVLATVIAFFVTTRRSTTVEIPSTELAAEPGQRTVFERDGVTLTLLGPARATVAGHHDGTVHVNIASGTLVADRTDNAPGLTLTAGSNTTVTHDRRFAVRVERGMVVLGAGEQAKEIVDRHALELTPASPAPVTPPPVAPVVTPPVAPVVTPPPVDEQPAPRPRVVAPQLRPEQHVESPPEVREPTKLPEVIFTATELYRRAEAALAIKDLSAARTLLEQLVRDYPKDPRVDAARYDLALIARAANDSARALALLDQILASGTDAGIRAAAKRLREQLGSK